MNVAYPSMIMVKGEDGVYRIKDELYDLINCLCSSHVPDTTTEHETDTLYSIPDDSECINDVDIELEKDNTGTVFGTIFNLTNTTVGVGTLTLPMAVRQCGLLLGLVLFFFVMFVSYYVFQVLLFAADKSISEMKKKGLLKTKEDCHNNISNRKIFEYVLGKVPSMCLEILYFLFCFGVCCMYVNVIGTSLSLQVNNWIGIKGHPLGNTYLLMGLVMVLIMYPLSIPKNISFLGYTSALSILSILIVDIIMVIRFIGKLSKNQFQLDLSNLIVVNISSFYDLSMIFLVIAAYFGSFISQFNLIPLYRELQHRSKKKMSFIVSASFSMSTFIYIISALVGYFMFLDVPIEQLHGNVLDNFPQDDILVSVGKILVILVIILSYPVVHYTARESIINILTNNNPISMIIAWKKQENHAIQHEIVAQENKNDNDAGYINLIIITTISCFGCYTIGLTIPNVMLLMNLSVSFSGIIGCFCFPLLLHLISYKSYWCVRFMDLTMLILCTIISMISFGKGVYDLITFIVQ